MVENDLKRNEKASKLLKNKLNLNSEPVAIKIIKNESELPENIKKAETPKRHCEMTKLASQGESFYATLEEQSCKGGAAALGLTELPEKLKSGEFYVKLGRFKDIKSAKETLNALPSLKKETYALVYTPLKEAKYTPDVIILFTKPIQAMKIAQSLIYEETDRINADFAGIQSICADAVAKPIKEGNVNITLGCDGSRKYAKLDDDELAVGINNNKLDILTKSIEAIMGE